MEHSIIEDDLPSVAIGADGRSAGCRSCNDKTAVRTFVCGDLVAVGDPQAFRHEGLEAQARLSQFDNQRWRRRQLLHATAWPPAEHRCEPAVFQSQRNPLRLG